MLLMAEKVMIRCFIYDIDNGYFFYDSDGTGENGLVKIARLDSGLNLDKNDLSITL
jgi:hypothetical protein